MSLTVILLIVLVVILFGGGGYYGYRSGAYAGASYGTGLLGGVLLLLLVLYVLGAFGTR